MSANGDVNIQITGDSTSLVAAAAKAQTAINSTGDVAASAGKKVASGLGAATTSAKSFGEGARKANETSQKLAATLSLVSPEAGAVAASLGKVAALGDVAATASTALGVSLSSILAVAGPVGIAVAALGATYLYLKNNLDEANAKVEASEKAAAVMVASVEKWKGALQSVNDEYDVSVVGVDALDVANKKAKATIDESAASHLALLEAAEKTARGVGSLAHMTDADADAWANAKQAVDEYRQAISTAKDRIDKTTAAKKGEKAATEKATAAAKAEAEAKAAAADAAKLAAENIANQAAIEKRENDAVMAGYRARAAAEEEERIAAQKSADLHRELEQEKLDATKEAAEETRKLREEDAAAYKAQMQSDAQFYTDSLASTFETVSKFADLEYNKRVDTMHALQDELADGEDTLTDHQKKSLKKRIAYQKEAAKKAFAIEQAAKIASAIINTAAGVVQALGNLPPPYSYVAAAISAAAGAVEIATIASQKPSFHAGGVMYPDEGNAKLLSGEAVLNRKATQEFGGPPAVVAANAGAMPMGGGVTVIRIGRNEAREIVRTDARANGYLPRLIDKRARNATTEPGLSGRRVVA